MLKSIDPLLGPDLLHALASMGHGDDLVIADANFPATACARTTVLGVPLRVDRDTAPVMRAILSVFPLDTMAEDAAARMAVTDDPDAVPDVQREVEREVERAHGAPLPMTPIERFAFYERARHAFAIVHTAEPRFFGCFAFRKGVVAPSDRKGVVAPGAAA